MTENRAHYDATPGQEPIKHEQPLPIQMTQEMLVDIVDDAVTRALEEQKPTHDKLFAALAIAQGEIQAAEATAESEVRKDGQLIYKFKYADLAACLAVIRKPLSDNGLALVQIPSLEDGIVHMHTILGHESGQSISCRMLMAPEKPGPQAIGTCMTYLRRYSLSALVGVAQFDDDARSASKETADTEFVSPEQIDQILVRADDYWGEDSPKVLERILKMLFENYNVSSVAGIPAKNFEQVLTLLDNQYKREQAAKNKKPEPPAPEKPKVDDKKPQPDNKKKDSK
jgi:hypothetical protein